MENNKSSPIINKISTFPHLFLIFLIFLISKLIIQKITVSLRGLNTNATKTETLVFLNSLLSSISTCITYYLYNKYLQIACLNHILLFHNYVSNKQLWMSFSYNIMWLDVTNCKTSMCTLIVATCLTRTFTAGMTCQRRFIEARYILTAW